MHDAYFCVSVEVPGEDTNHRQIMINIVNLAAILFHSFHYFLYLYTLLERTINRFQKRAILYCVLVTIEIAVLDITTSKDDTKMVKIYLRSDVVCSLIAKIMQLVDQLLIIGVIVELFWQSRLVRFHILNLPLYVSLLLVQDHTELEECISRESHARADENIVGLVSFFVVDCRFRLDCTDIQTALNDTAHIHLRLLLFSMVRRWKVFNKAENDDTCVGYFDLILILTEILDILEANHFHVFEHVTFLFKNFEL